MPIRMSQCSAHNFNGFQYYYQHGRLSVKKPQNYSICSACVSNGQAIKFVIQYHNLFKKSQLVSTYQETVQKYQTKVQQTVQKYQTKVQQTVQKYQTKVQQTVQKYQKRRLHDSLEVGEGLLNFFNKHIAELMQKYINFTKNIPTQQKELSIHIKNSLNRLQTKLEKALSYIIAEETDLITSSIRTQLANNENKIKTTEKYRDSVKTEMEELIFLVTPSIVEEKVLQSKIAENQVPQSKNCELTFNKDEVKGVIAIIEANIEESKKKSESLSQLIKEGENFVEKEIKQQRESMIASTQIQKQEMYLSQTIVLEKTE